MAKDIICSCLSRDQFRLIMHLCNAKLIWDRISGWAAVGRPTEECGVSRVLAASVYEWANEGEVRGDPWLRDVLVRNVG